MKIFYSILLPAAFALLFSTTACSAKKKPVVKTYLTVESEPSEATVYLLKADRGKTPFLCSLREGTYIVRVSKEGFVPQWKPVSLKKGERKKIKFQLQPVTADIMLESVPSGAIVTFQGKTAGATPLILRDLPAGQHSAVLKTPEYAPRAAEWTIASPRPQKIRVELSSNMGSVRITSEPTRASVFIDGKKVGLTPYTTRIEQGKYRIKVERSGFEAQEKSIGVNKDKEAKVKFTLSAKPSQINITTVPSEALITVNGKQYGKSPVKLKSLPAGKYTIEAMKSEYDSASRTVNIAPGQTVPLNLKLTYNLCSVEFVTVPAGVKVSLNDKAVGVTEPDPDSKNFSKPFRISKLKPGKYRLKFTHKRARPSQIVKTITLVKGEDLRLKSNINMWIENAEVKLKTGEIMVGRLLTTYSNGDILFEQVKGISARYKKEEIESVRHLKVQE